MRFDYLYLTQYRICHTYEENMPHLRGGYTAPMRRIYHTYEEDILHLRGGYTTPHPPGGYAAPTRGGYTAPTRRIYRTHQEDIPHLRGGYAAPTRRIYGVHIYPPRMCSISDLYHYDQNTIKGPPPSNNSIHDKFLKSMHAVWLYVLYYL